MINYPNKIKKESIVITKKTRNYTKANLGESFTAKITNINSGKNLSIYEPRNVIQYHDSTSKAQQWKFVRQSDGSYMIQNVKYGKYLDVSGGSSKSGTNVHIWDKLNNSAQRWFIYENYDGYVLRPACSSTCVLDVYDASKKDEANVQIWTYHGGEAQVFKINKIK